MRQQLSVTNTGETILDIYNDKVTGEWSEGMLKSVSNWRLSTESTTDDDTIAKSISEIHTSLHRNVLLPLKYFLSQCKLFTIKHAVSLHNCNNFSAFPFVFSTGSGKSLS